MADEVYNRYKEYNSENWELLVEDFAKKYAGVVENDSEYVWINEHCNTIASIDIGYVMDEPETEPFQASRMLDNNINHPAWEYLYLDYLKRSDEQ